MPSIKRNLIANFFGRLWTALLSVLFLPYYVEIIGIEAYGIVGFYTTLLGLFSVLDLGLGTTMNREMARLSPNGEAQELRNLTRTVEWIFWPMAILIGGIVFLLAPFLSRNWFVAQELSPEVIQQALYAMGLAVTFLWPVSLYNGGLMGLQKQVALNAISCVTATIRAIGLLVILTYVSPTLSAFFIWQIVVNALQTILCGVLFWKSLPKTGSASTFDIQILRRVRNFSLGITSISILVIVLTQLDKVILSKMLSLEMFGYYTFATVVASTLTYLTGPIFSAFFPLFTQSASADDADGRIHGVYHRGCQLMAVCIIPVALIVICFSPELIFLWTRNAETTAKTSLLVSLIMTGNLLNGLMTLPYGLQLAYGWTKLGFYQNIVGIIVLVPLLIWGTARYGVIGAGCVWILLNAGYICLSVPFMHRKIIKKEKMRWYVQDVALPLSGALAVVLCGRWFCPGVNSHPMVILAYLFLVFILSLLAAALVTPHARNWVSRVIFRFTSEEKRWNP